MNRGAVKVDHCYSMAPVNGRRTIARVTNLFKITAMAADKEHEIETLELNPTVVRFVWRHAAYPTVWGRGQQHFLLDVFPLAGKKKFLPPCPPAHPPLPAANARANPASPPCTR